MREEEFRNYLIGNEDIQSKVKAVTSRVAKALKVERELYIDLDLIVKNDEQMYQLLLDVQEKLNDRQYHNVFQNAVRKYYSFVNGKEFPRMAQYEKIKNSIKG